MAVRHHEQATHALSQCVGHLEECWMFNSGIQRHCLAGDEVPC